MSIHNDYLFIGIIRDVRQRMPGMEANFVPLRETVELLKSNAIELDLGLVGEEEALDFLERAPLAWDNTVNKTFRVKESIQPLQNAMVDFIKRDIADYVSRVKLAHREFRDAQHGPFTWPSDRIKDAYESMDKTYAKMKVLEAEAESFKNLQELFELNKIKAPELVTLRTELKLLKQVWDCVGVVESLFGSWSDTLWLDIRPDDLVDECKKLATHVKRLPRRLRDWPCYLRLQGSVANMASILPLVSELRSPCMRDRHWKAVASECHKPVDKGPGFCLADLLKLQLHEHVEGIMEIVEVAQKENKVEQKLKQIEKFWGVAVLEMARHKDTEVQVIVSPDDLIETLDEHNIQLQSMAAMGRGPVGEAPITVGAVLHSWNEDQVDGVVVVGPWGCGPSLVAESLLRQRTDIPSLFLYRDGTPSDGRKLDGFAFRLRRALD